MKKFLIPLLAVVLAVGASAYSVKPHLLTQKNFTYNLVGQSGADDPINTSNPNNYSLTGNNGTDPLFCSGTAHQCGVIADENGSTGKPVMSGSTPEFEN